MLGGAVARLAVRWRRLFWGWGSRLPVDDPLRLIGIGPDELVAGHSAGLCTVLRGKLTA
jgi:hypothetical protein